jgi:hypothetical protein
MERILTYEDIEKFRRLVKEHRGVELTPQQAADLAEQLLQVLRIVRDVGSKQAPIHPRSRLPADASTPTNAAPVQGQLF